MPIHRSESQIENKEESNIEFEEIKGEQIVDAVAHLVSDIHAEQPQRTQLTPEQAREAIAKDFDKPNAVTIAMLRNGEVIGFSWAYEIFESDLGVGKDKKSPELKSLFGEDKRVFYGADTGLRHDLRGQGLGEKLMKERMARVQKAGATALVLSTSANKDFPARNLDLKLNFKDLSEQDHQKKGTSYMIYEFKQDKGE